MRCLSLIAGLMLGELTAAAAAPAPAAPTQGASLAGCWRGSVFSGPGQFRAALELTGSAGRLRGAFHALARSLDSDSVADVRQWGDSLEFAVPAVRSAAVAARLDPARAMLSGTIRANGATGPVAFERSAAPHPARAFLGFWNGNLEQNGTSVLRVLFKIEAAPCGDVLVRMDSPEQGVENIPVSAVRATPESLAIEVAAINGSYRAAATPDGRRLHGTWTQHGGTFTLNLERGDSIVPTRRPQDPVPPFPYEERDVTFRNASHGITLAGTLSLPPGDWPLPAVVLLSGSGAQNRDEAIMGHRPFRVIADHLARRGIAVLRFDDRGVGGSGGNTFTATLEDNAADALAAVQFLKAQPSIDSARIGLVGHSEGGWVAPLAASRSRDVAFIVLLAGPGVSGEELLYLQSAAIFRAEGAPEEAITAYLAYARVLFDVIKRDSTFDSARRAIEERRARLLDSLPGPLAAALDSMWAATPEAQREQQLRLYLTPWFRYLLTYDPRPALAQVRVPILALIGEKDLQVPPRENVAALRATCTARGHPDCTVLELQGLNHLFQNAPTGRPAEYGRIEETFAPRALEALSGWILERLVRREP